MLTSFTQAQYNKIIVNNPNGGNLIQANLDGSNRKELSNLIQTYYDVDIDTIHQKIYFSMYNGIYSLSYDGTIFDTIIDVTSNPNLQ